MLGHDSDPDLSGSSNGEAIGNAPLELSNLGAQLPDRDLLRERTPRRRLAGAILGPADLAIKHGDEMHRGEHDSVS